jgi:hypothetical protein
VPDAAAAATSPKSWVVLYPAVDPKEPNGAALKALLQRGKTARAMPASAIPNLN